MMCAGFLYCSHFACALWFHWEVSRWERHEYMPKRSKGVKSLAHGVPSRLKALAHPPDGDVDIC